MKNKCILCGDEFEGYGNNPSPLADSSKECCDECNYAKVIPARLKIMFEKKKLKGGNE